MKRLTELFGRSQTQLESQSVVQAKLMNYISYPEIHAPEKQSPVSEDSLQSADYIHSVETTNHSLQSTKTVQSKNSLQLHPYHLKLKDSYIPVQHPPRSVPLEMQSAYKADLDRLVKEGIITEVDEHIDWINSVVPVMKEDGSLRLCLDPKDLNKAIKRNQWHARTPDDI